MPSTSLSRRIKCILIASQVMPNKYAIIALMRKLPEDAEVVRFDFNMQLDANVIVIRSWSFPEVPVGQMAPEFEATLSHEDVDNARSESIQEAMSRAQELMHTAKLPTFAREHLALDERIVPRPAPIAQCRCDLAYNGGHFLDCHFRKVKQS